MIYSVKLLPKSKTIYGIYVGEKIVLVVGPHGEAVPLAQRMNENVKRKKTSSPESHEENK